MVQKIEEEKIKESLTEAKLLFCCGIKAKFEPFSIVKGLSLSLLVLSMRTKQRLKTQHEAKKLQFLPKNNTNITQNSTFSDKIQDNYAKIRVFSFVIWREQRFKNYKNCEIVN